MKAWIKIVLYIVLLGGTIILWVAFGAAHGRVLAQSSGASKTAMMSYLGGFVLLAIGLGLLVAYDVAHFFGRRAERAILQGGPPLETPSAVEEAARLRKSGEPLEAVRVLRDFLGQHPKELELMSEIAEIYNHDLNQPLSAALEYEELIRHKLPAEQWAWAALHLAKLYGRLDQPEKSAALLERLVKDYGRTVAAGRARKVLAGLRLGQPEEPLEES